MNAELWKEAQAYGDIQFMPFVDYYDLISYKAVAVCILGVCTMSFAIKKQYFNSTIIVPMLLFSSLNRNLGHNWCVMQTKILPAKYIMKTDDDAFVRIDELLSSLKGKPSDGLLYGRVAFESSPHREKDSKWYISEEVFA